MGVISFQKIFGFCDLRGHKVEIRWDVTLVHGHTYGRTECEDRARILKQNSQKPFIYGAFDGPKMIKFCSIPLSRNEIMM